MFWAAVTISGLLILTVAAMALGGALFCVALMILAEL